MTKMTLLPVMMLVMSVVEGWDKEKTQCTTVAVNTTQETLCCQSLAPMRNFVRTIRPASSRIWMVQWDTASIARYEFY